MDREIAPKYIRDNFKPSDRLAVVLLNKRRGEVTQRIASAEQIAAPEFQAWLRHKNAQKHEVYISMNVLRQDAQGRTKNDVDAIRHLYLDFDENGTEAVERLLNREDLPKPNYRISSSPGKWQVVWKTQGFSPHQAEQLQKSFAQQMGADPAATDSVRVLRLPGFYNHKYENPHFVSVETLSERVHEPQDFPEPDLPRQRTAKQPPTSRPTTSGGLSQSEHDWAYAKRALWRGESPDLVKAAIATWRRYDKHNPQAYAELTVKKASQELSAEISRERPSDEPAR